MKTAKFTLNNKELLLVELPEGKNPSRYILSPVCKDGVWSGVELEEWKLVGKLSEVTDYAYSLLLPPPVRLFTGSLYFDFIKDEYLFDTAKESFFSKLEAEGINMDWNNTFLFEKV